MSSLSDQEVRDLKKKLGLKVRRLENHMTMV